MFRLFRAICLGIGLVVALSAPSSSVDAANGSVVYTYDALGRVRTVSYDTGVIILYTYDAKGNPTTQTININSATLSWGSGNWGETKW